MPVVVNESPHEPPADDRSLLDWLRNDVGLTGTKYGCGEQACGACSVLLDGALARACVVPARAAIDRQVTTIEGLADEHGLHPVQRAFVEAGAMQCGFCTPGMVIAATALLNENPDPTDDQIARWMAPNVCRCGAHPRIVAAIHAVDGHRALLESAAPISLAIQPRVPWDLVEIDERDYFDVLGDGLVVVAPAPASEGAWSPTGGAWLHVGVDGHVVAFTGKVEVGQGTRRALRLLVAEEMGVAVDDVAVVMGDTDVCPFDVGTFGSLAMPTATEDLRRAAAIARAEARPAAGTRRVVVATGDEPIRPAAAWQRAGSDVRAGDPAAVTGAKQFPSDLRRPGMRFGAVLRAPAFGAEFTALDVTRARALPDVTVVVEGSFVGVAAATLEAARCAIDAVDVQWKLPDALVEPDLEQHFRTHAIGTAQTTEAGDVGAALQAATATVQATYTTAYIAHAPIETRVALAEWSNDGRLTVWTGTQRPFGTRAAIAETFAIDEARVRVIVPDAGTGFGGKHDPETAIAATHLAHAAQAPVLLQWTREEEFTAAYLRPAAVIDVRAGTTSDGDLAAWDFLDVNAGTAGIAIPYDVADRRIAFQPAESPLRQGSYRGLAATANNFARESAIDELAHAVRMDPLEFRLRNCRDERLVAVLRATADHFGWGDPLVDARHGAGLAIGLEKGGRVATCALVRVDDRVLTIVRVVTAFECGTIVDPDNLRNQIVGATIMGLGGALSEAIHFDGGRILNPRFSEYGLPRFPDIPPIDVVLVNRPDLPPAGAGETPIMGIAPALANAIFAATGRRLRALPLLERDPAGGARLR